MGKARASTTARGYGHHHQQIRAHFQAIIDSGQPVYCWRPDCGRQLHGTDWHLGHDDNDRTIYRGPECIHCNLSAAADKTNSKRAQGDKTEAQSRTW